MHPVIIHIHPLIVNELFGLKHIWDSKKDLEESTLSIVVPIMPAGAGSPRRPLHPMCKLMVDHSRIRIGQLNQLRDQYHDFLTPGYQRTIEKTIVELNTTIQVATDGFMEPVKTNACLKYGITVLTEAENLRLKLATQCIIKKEKKNEKERKKKNDADLRAGIRASKLAQKKLKNLIKLKKKPSARVDLSKPTEWGPATPPRRPKPDGIASPLSQVA